MKRISNPRTPSTTQLVFVASVLACLATTSAFTQQKEHSAMHHAHGTFTVKTQPLSTPLAEGLARFSLDKQIHGDIEGTSKGEMLAGGDFTKGAAGYVAIETITGTLAGKQGTFALQQMGSMDSSGMKIEVIVVPGSGTGELKGIAGTFIIHNDAGSHSYDLDYTMPD